MSSRVALRERPLLDVLDLAVRFATAHAGAYAKASAAVLAPAFAVSWAATLLGGWWAAWALTLVLTAFASAPFTVLASRLVFSDAVRLRSVLAASLAALPRLVAVRSLELLALLASMLVAGIPWLYLGSVLLFVVEVVLLEDAGIASALVRSQRITSAHFSPVASTMLVLLLAPVASALVADVAGREILGSLLQIPPPASIFHEGGSWLALVGWWTSLPLLATCRFFVYLDVRTRSEGWDIQTRFAAIAVRLGSPARERRAA